MLGLDHRPVAIRRQGIYFTMITLALSQMFFFFCLQAPFTHGEDGIQSVPRGHLLGFIDLNQFRPTCIISCWPSFLIGMVIDLAVHQLAFRHDLEVDPRKRGRAPFRLAIPSPATSSGHL